MTLAVAEPDVTGEPPNLAVAVALLETAPAVTSAAVVTYEPVHVTVAFGARAVGVVGHVTDETFESDTV